MNQPTLFNLEEFTNSSLPAPVSDPFWDEITALQPEDRWNPDDFGEVPFLSDDGQLTIFYDHSQEPPDPDDYLTVNDYHLAWAQWRTLVGAQVKNVSDSTIDTPVKPRVGAQVALHTKKTAPQHDTHWVEKYWVERSGNKYWYYRYCWMVARKKKRIYLGSVDSNLARHKKASVEIAIADGKLPDQIGRLIQGWKPSQSICYNRAVQSFQEK